MSASCMLAATPWWTSPSANCNYCTFSAPSGSSTTTTPAPSTSTTPNFNNYRSCIKHGTAISIKSSLSSKTKYSPTMPSISGINWNAGTNKYTIILNYCNYSSNHEQIEGYTNIDRDIIAIYIIYIHKYHILILNSIIIKING